MVQSDDESSGQEWEPLNPVFNWVGSKRRYCERLVDLMPKDYDIDDHTYFEPFLGSGSFLFYMQPANAVVGDIDQNVTKSLINIKQFPEKVISHLKKFYKDDDVKQNYIKLCKGFSKLEPLKQTAAFIFISKHSFGSNLIYNKERTGFTLCYRNLVVKTDYNNIENVSSYLKDNNVKIKNGDFRSITASAKKGDFVFMDPPYMTTRKTNKQYYNADTNLDVESLVEECLRLHRKGCKVLLINSNCKSLKDPLTPFFKCKPFKANEKILGAHGKDYTDKRTERIYYNYD